MLPEAAVPAHAQQGFACSPALPWRGAKGSPWPFCTAPLLGPSHPKGVSLSVSGAVGQGVPDHVFLSAHTEVRLGHGGMKRGFARGRVNPCLMLVHCS